MVLRKRVECVIFSVWWVIFLLLEQPNAQQWRSIFTAVKMDRDRKREIRERKTERRT